MYYSIYIYIYLKLMYCNDSSSDVKPSKLAIWFSLRWRVVNWGSPSSPSRLVSWLVPRNSCLSVGRWRLLMEDIWFWWRSRVWSEGRFCLYRPVISSILLATEENKLSLNRFHFLLHSFFLGIHLLSIIINFSLFFSHQKDLNSPAMDELFLQY